MRKKHFLICLITSIVFCLEGSIRANEEATDASVYADYIMALVYDNEGLIESAERIYKKALEKDPSDTQIRLRLGVDYIRLGKLEEAIAEFKTILESTPENIPARTILASLYFSLERCEPAIREYEELLKGSQMISRC